MAGDAELLVSLRKVPRNHFAAEVERLGDLGGAKACGSQSQNPCLHVRQPRFSHGSTMGDTAHLTVTPR